MLIIKLHSEKNLKRLYRLTLCLQRCFSADDILSVIFIALGFQHCYNSRALLMIGRYVYMILHLSFYFFFRYDSSYLYLPSWHGESTPSIPGERGTHLHRNYSCIQNDLCKGISHLLFSPILCPPLFYVSSMFNMGLELLTPRSRVSSSTDNLNVT